MVYACEDNSTPRNFLQNICRFIIYKLRFKKKKKKKIYRYLCGDSFHPHAYTTLHIGLFMRFFPKLRILSETDISRFLTTFLHFARVFKSVFYFFEKLWELKNKKEKIKTQKFEISQNFYMKGGSLESFDLPKIFTY